MRLRFVSALCGLILVGCLDPSENLGAPADHRDDDIPDNAGERLTPAQLADEESRARELPMPHDVGGAYLWDAADAHAARINPHRVSDGATTIHRSRCLDGVARRWARRMASGICGEEPICHRGDGGPSGIVTQVERCWSWMRIGENVAVGAAEASVFEAFLDSPHHHENIDNDWNADGAGKFGIGVFRRGDGRLFVTQVFATRR